MLRISRMTVLKITPMSKSVTAPILLTVPQLLTV